MKGEKSTVSSAEKIVRSLTTHEKDAREREALEERGGYEEMARKPQER